jgi:hypothetical protein
MERSRTARNLLIVAALGVALYYLPGGGNAARGVEAALWALFAIGIAYLGLRAYRENGFRIAALGDRHRGILYGSVALAVFCYMARHRMWETGFGELFWFVLVAAVVWGLLEVYRHARSYS